MEFTTEMFCSGSVWKALLLPFKGRSGLKYLEVGVFEGQSLFWMFSNILTDPSSSAVVVDLFLDVERATRFQTNLDQSGLRERVRFVHNYSRFSLRELPLNSFDIIYLDGAHSAKEVLIDAVLAWDLLRVGGVLIFDDYRDGRDNFPEEGFAQPSVDFFFRQFRDELRLLKRDHQFVVQKMTEPMGESLVLGNMLVYNYVNRKDGGTADLQFHRREDDSQVPTTQKQRDVVFGVIQRLKQEKDFETVDLSPMERSVFEQLGWRRTYDLAQFELPAVDEV